MVNGKSIETEKEKFRNAFMKLILIFKKSWFVTFLRPIYWYKAMIEKKWKKCFYWSVMNDFICNQFIVISFQASNYIWPKSNSEATVTTISTRVKGLKSTMRSFGGLRILWKISIYKSLLKNEYENLTYFKWIIETMFNAIYVANIF